LQIDMKVSTLSVFFVLFKYSQISSNYREGANAVW